MSNKNTTVTEDTNDIKILKQIKQNYDCIMKL
jgi:hypothetical protein